MPKTAGKHREATEKIADVTQKIAEVTQNATYVAQKTGEIPRSSIRVTETNGDATLEMPRATEWIDQTAGTNGKAPRSSLRATAPRGRLCDIRGFLRDFEGRLRDIGDFLCDFSDFLRDIGEFLRDFAEFPRELTRRFGGSNARLRDSSVPLCGASVWLDEPIDRLGDLTVGVGRLNARSGDVHEVLGEMNIQPRRPVVRRAAPQDQSAASAIRSASLR